MKPTLYELFEIEYRDRHPLQPTSTRTARCDVRRWERVIGRLPVDRIQPEHFIAFRTAPFGTTSKRNTVQTVIRLLRFAQALGLLKALPIVHPEWQHTQGRVA